MVKPQEFFAMLHFAVSVWNAEEKGGAVPVTASDWLQAVLWCKHQVKGGGIVCNNIVFNTYKGSNVQVTHLN